MQFHQGRGVGVFVGVGVLVGVGVPVAVGVSVAVGVTVGVGVSVGGVPVTVGVSVGVLVGVVVRSLIMEAGLAWAMLWRAPGTSKATAREAAVSKHSVPMRNSSSRRRVCTGPPLESCTYPTDRIGHCPAQAHSPLVLMVVDRERPEPYLHMLRLGGECWPL